MLGPWELDIKAVLMVLSVTDHAAAIVNSTSLLFARLCGRHRRAKRACCKCSGQLCLTHTPLFLFSLSLSLSSRSLSLSMPLLLLLIRQSTGVAPLRLLLGLRFRFTCNVDRTLGMSGIVPAWVCPCALSLCFSPCCSSTARLCLTCLHARLRPCSPSSAQPHRYTNSFHPLCHKLLARSWCSVPGWSA